MLGAMVNAFLGIGLLVLIILVVYLVDRVNSLEKETRRVAQMAAQPPAPAAQALDPWAGLSGKDLWDAVSGRPPAGMSSETMQDIRGRYEIVIQKHIQSLFDEGVRDGKMGLSGEPKNPRSIQTSQGAVESWLPMAQVNTLYKCGLDSTQLSGEGLQPVRAALDEAGQQLFSKTRIEQTEPLSASLLPTLAAQAANPAAPPTGSDPASGAPASGRT